MALAMMDWFVVLTLRLRLAAGRLEAANEQRAIFQQLGDRSREAGLIHRIHGIGRGSWIFQDAW